MGNTGLRVCILSANKRCHQNSITSARVVRYIHKNGHKITDKPAEADVILVNTCGVLQLSKDFSTGLLSKALKDRKPGSRIICGGCLSKIDRPLVEKDFPEISIVADPSEMDPLIGATVPYKSVKEGYYDETLYKWLGPDPLSLVPVIGPLGEKLVNWMGDSSLMERLHLRQKSEAIHHANKVHVQIGTGCAGRCAYCTIKVARGESVSRPRADILADIKAVWRPGTTLNLVADDCGSYGCDTGSTLCELVLAIAGAFPEIPVDLRYVNPVWVQKDPEGYKAMFAGARINSINLCMQSGADRIIRLMNRHYEADKVLGTVRELKKISPKTLFRSHFIVGYPTETAQEFALTRKAAEDFHFFNTFMYSHNAGTESFKLKDNVPGAVKLYRQKVLQAYLWLKLVIPDKT